MSDYPVGMTLRPIEVWPGTPTVDRERSNFSAPWRATLELLERELAQLASKRGYVANSVLQIAMREQDFRISDGMPRATAKPTHPGVILNITSKHGPLSYPCDKFDRWQDNLRAIALGLEALRKVERYGITQTGQQYTGFKALGAGGTAIERPLFASADAAERFLRETAPADGAILDTVQSVYRRAARVAHPDRGGARELWDKVEAAAELLRAAGRL